ncbi:MAG: TetR/AcrR family transcriptional regulator [Proteobacteria bacterium]|nr:TetR/AcrR family transcriptional regulator [Pseudomonadota bacterium]
MAESTTLRRYSAAGTRERILRGALAQFAGLGLSGASLREISKSADVPLSALHYHFGSKENLFIAVVEHYLGGLAKERLELLAACRERASSPSVEDIVDAFIRPLISLAATPDGLEYVRLQLRPFENPSIVQQMATLAAPSALPFLNALADALPGVSRPKLTRAYRLMVWGVVHTLVDSLYERLTQQPALPPKKPQQEQLRRELVEFYVAGFHALAGGP